MGRVSVWIDCSKAVSIISKSVYRWILTITLHQEGQNVTRHKQLRQDPRSDKRCLFPFDGADDPPELHVNRCSEEERREEDEDDLQDVGTQSIVGAFVAAYGTADVACELD